MDNEIKKDFFELLCFILSSARGLMEEPQVYGPFRLVDTASRIISILEKYQMADDFLLKEKSKIEEGKYSVMEGEDTFRGFLDQIMLDFARELKNRD
jgi:hypothetical protein